MHARKFIFPHASGEAWGVVSTERLWADVFAIKYNKPERHLPASVWMSLFQQAFDAARDFEAKSIVCRIRSDYEAAKFGEILKSIGFSKKSVRIEYRAEIERLPLDNDSPIRWHSMRDLGWSVDNLVSFTEKVLEDAHDTDPDEEIEDTIQDWLRHDELTNGPDCIHIGFIDDSITSRPVALVIAQVAKATGWSRLSYMGLVKQYRKKGLGRWVHLHGFSMMKEQGGIHYHGGTNAKNEPMRKLFIQHGCEFVWEMEEWEFSFRGCTR